MPESKSRFVLVTLLTIASAAASAQQPVQAPPQGQAPATSPGATPPPGQMPPAVMMPQGPQGQIQIMAPLVTPPQTAPVALTPPEIAAAEAEAATRRYESGIDLHTFVAEVAESTGKEFLIDPRVRARIYSVPKIDRPTYPILLSVLRLNGYMAVEIGGKVNILPDANARSMPTRLVQRDDSGVPDDEVITRVITVPGNNASNLVIILRPLLPVSAHLAAVVEGDENKKLIVVDTYANVRRIQELIETLGQ
jgi:general secretion pathway protein D